MLSWNSVITEQSKQCNIPKDSPLHEHRCENVKSRSMITFTPHHFPDIFPRPVDNDEWFIRINQCPNQTRSVQLLSWVGKQTCHAPDKTPDYLAVSYAVGSVRLCLVWLSVLRCVAPSPAAQSIWRNNNPSICYILSENQWFFMLHCRNRDEPVALWVGRIESNGRTDGRGRGENIRVMS
jgi:hypothetical protein